MRHSLSLKRKLFNFGRGGESVTLAAGLAGQRDTAQQGPAQQHHKPTPEQAQPQHDTAARIHP